MARFARVGAGLSGAAAAIGANAIRGGGDLDARNARAVKEALGQLKGPLMKVAQMATTVPDLLPPEFAAGAGRAADERAADERRVRAPPDGRRARRRTGAPGSPSSTCTPAAAASLGQVHRATALDGRALAVKLQYPDMQSAVESDLGQMRAVMAVGRQMFGQVDTREIAVEISARIREELDYEREAKAMALYGGFFAGRDDIAAPEPLAELSTGRLLTMTWLEGRGLMDFEGADQATRNRIARLLFEAWWTPLIRIGVIHGDPHLGNYTFAGAGEAARLNLLDFGCIRIFPPSFITGVHQALPRADRRRSRRRRPRPIGSGASRA